MRPIALLLVVVAVLFTTPVRAQLPPHQFSVRLGYAATVVMRDMAVDNAGNIYAVGSFSNTIDLDPGPGEDLRTTEGLNDIFLVKLSPNGDYLWGRTYGNTYDNLCNAIAYDLLSDAIIIGGPIYDALDFDGIEVYGIGDVFLYKLGTDGTPIWANDAGSQSNASEGLSDLVVDADGSIYFTGSWAPSGFPSQVLLKKCTSGGAAVAEYIYGGANTDYGSYIALGPDGDVHVAGIFKYRDGSPYNVTFGDFMFQSGSTLDYGNNIFYLRIDAGSGTVLNAKIVAHRMDQEGPSGLVVDAEGSVYLSGAYGSSFNGTASVFGIPVTQVPDNDMNGFVVKLHPDGAANSWARVFPNGINFSRISGMNLDANGVIHAFGESSPGLDIDPTSSSVLTTPAGNFNFLTRLNNDGSFHDGYLYNNIITTQVLPQPNGALILGGNYAASNDFDPGAGVVSLPSAGGGVPDAFVCKLYDATTGVTSAHHDDVRVTPNPACDRLTVQSLQPGSRCMILDLAGHVVLSSRAIGSMLAIEVSALAPGAYVLRVEGPDGRLSSQRVVVSSRW